jgi:hypothetical protein
LQVDVKPDGAIRFIVDEMGEFGVLDRKFFSDFEGSADFADKIDRSKRMEFLYREISGDGIAQGKVHIREVAAPDGGSDLAPSTAEAAGGNSGFQAPLTEQSQAPTLETDSSLPNLPIEVQPISKQPPQDEPAEAGDFFELDRVSSRPSRFGTSGDSRQLGGKDGDHQRTRVLRRRPDFGRKFSLSSPFDPAGSGRA